MRLLDCLRKDRDYFYELFACVAFCTACRVSDVVSFRWKDILHRSRLTITEKKTGKTRVVTFNESVRRKIAELHGLLGSPDQDTLMFHGPKKDEPISTQYINRRLKMIKVKYQLDLENFSTHTFRKTFGRHVYELNNRSAESLMLLNKILNHHNLTITKAYIGITQDEINNVYNSIRF
jgi:integrase